MARSLNKVELIGNLTRDPELRYTPQGSAVCTFGLATNRQWTTDTGEKKEDVEFHRIVAWNKLAEICAQLLAKGRKAYVEGRLQTRRWTGQDGNERITTEIVINNMIILDSRGATLEDGGQDFDIPDEVVEDKDLDGGGEELSSKARGGKNKDNKKSTKKVDTESKEQRKNNEEEEDIPF